MLKIQDLQGLAACGGGVAAIPEAGVVIALAEAGLWAQFKVIAGTSAGSGLALIAALYPPDNLEAVVMRTNFAEMIQDGWFGESLWRFFWRGGLHTHHRIEAWLKGLIVGALGEGWENITYKEWHEAVLRGGPPYKDIVSFATDMDVQVPVALQFSWDSQFADLPVWKGICASMAFEDMFMPVPIRMPDGHQHRFSDGGTARNYPIDYFPKGQALGIFLGSTEEIAFLRDGKPQSYAPYTGIIGLNKRAIDGAVDGQPEAAIRAYAEQTIFVQNLGLTALDFDRLTPELKKQLVQEGRQATKEYLQRAEVLAVSKPVLSAASAPPADEKHNSEEPGQQLKQEPKQKVGI